jgi:hypothetical protein
MRAVLDALGRPPDFYLVEGGGHVPTGSQWVEIAHRLRAFLMQQLEPR